MDLVCRYHFFFFWLCHVFPTMRTTVTDARLPVCEWQLNQYQNHNTNTTGPRKLDCVHHNDDFCFSRLAAGTVDHNFAIFHLCDFLSPAEPMSNIFTSSTLLPFPCLSKVLQLPSLTRSNSAVYFVTFTSSCFIFSISFLHAPLTFWIFWSNNFAHHIHTFERVFPNPLCSSSTSTYPLMAAQLFAGVPGESRQIPCPFGLQVPFRMVPNLLVPSSLHLFFSNLFDIRVHLNFVNIFN